MAAVQESLVSADLEPDTRGALWAEIARSYAAFTSPLVPCSEDIHLYERTIAAQCTPHDYDGLSAVVLGVTPGIALMKWPPKTLITAVDFSRDVIRALWPGDVPGVRQATCATWFDIPRERGTCDVVVGDGSLNACRFPADVRSVVHSAAHVLKSEGLLITRVYVRPQCPETVDDVFDAAFDSEGLSVDAFKLRLWLAMQRTVEEGVAVKEAAKALDRHDLTLRVMRERLGWRGAAIGPFASWRTSGAVYSFPSLDELLEVTGEMFDLASVTYPEYELGNCCPTLVMRLRAS